MALLTFRADLDSGEGEIKVWPKFEKLNPLLQADLLRDWVEDLNQLYDDTVCELDKSLDSDENHLGCLHYPNCDTEGCGEI